MKSEGEDDVKRVWKYPIASASISSSVSAHKPLALRSFVTMFRALRCLVVAWKNFVFWSPSLRQIARLFCFQYSSSSLKAAQRLHLRLRIASWEKSSSVWACSSRSFMSSIFFLAFEWLSRFHREINLRHWAILSYKSSLLKRHGSFQPYSTVSRNPFLPIHLLSNLKFLLPSFLRDRKRVNIGL